MDESACVAHGGSLRGAQWRPFLSPTPTQKWAPQWNKIPSQKGNDGRPAHCPAQPQSYTHTHTHTHTQTHWDKQMHAHLSACTNTPSLSLSLSLSLSHPHTQSDTQRAANMHKSIHVPDHCEGVNSIISEMSDVSDLKTRFIKTEATAAAEGWSDQINCKGQTTQFTPLIWFLTRFGWKSFSGSLLAFRFRVWVLTFSSAAVMTPLHLWTDGLKLSSGFYVCFCPRSQKKRHTSSQTNISYSS